MSILPIGINHSRAPIPERRVSNMRIHPSGFGATVLSLTLSLSTVPLLAQDTSGVSTSTSGAVIQGKAPVAKDLLTIRFPKPKSFMLSNGITVYVLEDHRFPAVRMRLTMRAGYL